MASGRILAVVLAAFALAGCAAATPAPVRMARITIATATAPPTLAIAATVTPANAEPTKVLAPAPVATFTSVPGPIDFQVLSIIDPAVGAPGYQAPPNTRLIAVEMVLANNSRPERITANPALLRVMDGRGYLGHCGEGRYEGEFAPVYLSPGDRVQGFVGCTISANAILFSAHYTIQETGGVKSVKVP